MCRSLCRARMKSSSVIPGGFGLFLGTLLQGNGEDVADLRGDGAVRLCAPLNELFLLRFGQANVDGIARFGARERWFATAS